MIKQTMAALLLTTSVASAADMMMDDMMMSGIQDKQIVDLTYVDQGSAYTEAVEGHTNQLDDSNARLNLEGRHNYVEYGVSANSEGDFSGNVGLVAPVGKGFGVAIGASAQEGNADGDKYVAALYEMGKVEARIQYNDESETTEVSGRYFVTSHWGVKAGVKSDDFGDLGEDSTYTVGISYKF